MKKFTAILLTVIMVASLFISCNNSIAPTVTDETVSVSFTEATSRSLTASLDPFDAINYYWAYKAEKTDSTGLNSGATSFAWVKNEGPGLSGVKIPGFSQGAWKFTLYAYKTRNNVDTNLAYKGEANTVLTKGGENKVAVTVSPISTGTGTLVVKINDIKIKKFDGTELGSDLQNGFTKEVTIAPMVKGGENPTLKTGENVSDYTYDANPGAYKVSVGLKQDGITFASGSVVATVYANLTTTVSGTLQEQITDASFDPSRNPDVLNLVASSDSIDYAEKKGDDSISLASPKAVGETESRITAVVKAQAGKDLVANLASEDGAGSAALKNAAKRETTLALSVDTISASEGSVSYEIGLSATITSKDSNGNTTATEVYTVNNLTQYLTATMKLQPGLSNVAVTHNSQEMQKLNSLTDQVTNNEGAYHYAMDSGTLTIMTKKFSPFEVRYSKFVADMNGRKFASVQEAMNAVSENGGTVTLLDDVDIESPIEVSKSVIFDLNGKTITNSKDIWNEDSGNWSLISVRGGDLTITGNGYLIAKENDCFAADVKNDGRLVIENGSFTGNLSSVYVFQGSLQIKGGEFSISQLSNGTGADQYRFLLNCYDPNYKGESIGDREYTGPANITVIGGTFKGFNPENNKAEGKDTNFVQKGYFAEYTQTNNTWTVKKYPVKKGDNYYPDLNAAIQAAANGDTITILRGANVTLDNGVANEGAKSRNITFKGTVTQTETKTETVDVITKATSAEGGMLNYQRGSSFTFEDLTIQAGEGSFDGIVCDELTFKNCTITGKLTLFGKATFINCTFENTMANQYSIWTWGGTDVTFEGCTFNTNGKAILLYGGASGSNPTNLVVNNCTFNDRNNGAAGKAAIEIGNDYNATYTLTVNNATVTGFAEGKNTGSKLWANKNSMDSEHLTVTIDGTRVH